MERWEDNGLSLVWTPETRLLETRFHAPRACVTGEQARAMVDQIDRWTGGTEGYGILIDCKNLVDTEPAWRSVLSAYYRSRPHRVVLAWHDVTILIRVAAEMFVLATPNVDGKSFSDEADARAFLKQRGYG